MGLFKGRLDKEIEDYLKHGSDYKYNGGRKAKDAARYVVLKEGKKGFFDNGVVRAGSGKVIPPKKK